MWCVEHWSESWPWSLGLNRGLELVHGVLYTRVHADRGPGSIGLNPDLGAVGVSDALDAHATTPAT